MSARVEVVIDRLVVHGLDRAAAAKLERDLQAALADLAAAWIGQGVAPPAAGDGRRRRPVTIAADTRTPLGAQVADAVATAVRQPAGTAASARQEVTP